MTSRDYANRKPTRKGKAKKRGSKGNPPKRFPVVVFIITLLGLTGFGYLLWLLYDTDEAVTTPVVVEKPKKATVKKDPNALPPRP